ncbi:MAG: hypothetical protein HYT67_00810 [Candidatus Yanofskybacteria bacterium]|nr:hypothetical protein [Candidatus Yanofskybacteria bacterium]
MLYAYNEVGGLINGVMFFFEKGDTEIAAATFEVINASEQTPTGIVWNGDCPTVPEVLSKLRQHGALDTGFLGVRLMIDEDRLLKELLTFMRENHPGLLLMVEEIDGQVFGTPQ